MSTGAEIDQATRLHGGRLIARRLKAHGVTKLFTLSGGHLFSIYDGCREEGIDLADARARRPGAGDALGAGLAAGDRPRPVRAAGDEARRDGRVDGGDPRPR